jgi:hypothetical protein
MSQWKRNKRSVPNSNFNELIAEANEMLCFILNVLGTTGTPFESENSGRSPQIRKTTSRRD